ncbi:hypothetical protein ACSTWH_005463, partial [Escherichia coli]
GTQAVLNKHPFLGVFLIFLGFKFLSIKSTFFKTFLYKTFCNRHTVCSAPADKKTRHFAGLCGSHQ